MGVLCPKDSCDREFDSKRGMKIHHARSHDEKIGFQTVECFWCEGEVEKRDCEVKRNERHFCDAECKQKEFSSRQSGEDNPRWDESKSKNEHTCKQCGELYKNYKDESDTKCCSRECYKKWMSDNWTGENCPAWRGGKYFYYGPSWQSARKTALREADYKCEQCGMSNDEHINEFDQELHVHHITKFREFGLDNHTDANKQDNLMAVCRDCHYEVES